eukprot:CAMPEP_0183334900 /NCGR_PEP_ID=MMETSP0164_2-20130417/3364_1 /TAXON_ID=221442 /ORGANISM="Coccolithus pelagicus ssp braarudi, Strain PLY182g" /LENGTH=199 /DNA_ID=CAMNT_0025504141 /DNA_START=12 /DNA_END=611 /DNA_ORIENTATION=-
MGLLRAVGITLSASSFAGVVKGFALFPVAIITANLLAILFVKSPISDQLIEVLVPIPVEKVPALAIVSLVILAAVSGVVVVVCLNLISGGYDNSQPRKMKGPAMADSHPAIFRLQSAHNNTLECLAMATACFWAATTHVLEPVLFAKLALFVLASRTLYIGAYVIDEDFLRTVFFICAITAITDIGLGAIFPDILAKYA